MGFYFKTEYKKGAYFRRGYDSTLDVVRLLEDGDIRNFLDVEYVIRKGQTIKKPELFAIHRICLQPTNLIFWWTRCKKDGSFFSPSPNQKRAQRRGAALGRLSGIETNLRTTLNDLEDLYGISLEVERRQLRFIFLQVRQLLSK